MKARGKQIKMNKTTDKKQAYDHRLWEKCVNFHGHECPGLAIGYRAALEGMKILEEKSPSEDEEIVCVTENDACGVDAVQFLTSCTLGKGNLIYRDTGKMAFSFFSRNSGKKVRFMLRPHQGPKLPREEERERILTAPLEDVFNVMEPAFDCPEKARLFQSQRCQECGEVTAENKMRVQEGRLVCKDCFQEYSRGW